ncbi:hypothetical protein [Streptomyces sp. NBC_00878]|uniref:hypothetical protein n=1 Tax=Streptomyces sp. NBC_00878 TaxID=2975854 RepID=UPI0022541EC2|nr:hypothetical protein [Streptomyces sp. NBC_00878]MCX4908871.1 hypothetical protein [Streptomyces sp. NBC_00878]
MANIRRVVTLVLAAAAITASAPAFAINASTDGAYAYTSGSDHYANIKDTKKDGHPVKAQYSRNFPDLQVYTLWEKAGYGNTATSGYGGMIYQIRACEYINNWPDDCSGWDVD